LQLQQILLRAFESINKNGDDDTIKKANDPSKTSETNRGIGTILTLQGGNIL